MNEDLIYKIGVLTLDELGDFIKEKGWKCCHCEETEYLIEEFGTTGLCSVSSMPYVAATQEGKFSITGSGAPTYTLLCANCYAITKYNALEIVNSMARKKRS